MTVTGQSLPSVLPAGILGNLVGAGLLVAATLGAGGEQELAGQLGWLTLAVAGLVVALLADAAVLLGGRRRLARVAAQLTPVARPLTGVAVRGAGPVKPPEPVVVGSSAAYYHRPDCPLVAGKPVSAFRPTAQVNASPRACGMCRP